jgi:hypothetical protein
MGVLAAGAGAPDPSAMARLAMRYSGTFATSELLRDLTCSPSMNQVMEPAASRRRRCASRPSSRFA